MLNSIPFFLCPSHLKIVLSSVCFSCHLGTLSSIPFPHSLCSQPLHLPAPLLLACVSNVSAVSPHLALSTLQCPCKWAFTQVLSRPSTLLTPSPPHPTHMSLCSTAQVPCYASLPPLPQLLKPLALCVSGSASSASPASPCKWALTRVLSGLTTSICLAHSLPPHLSHIFVQHHPPPPWPLPSACHPAEQHRCSGPSLRHRLCSLTLVLGCIWWCAPAWSLFLQGPVGPALALNHVQLLHPNPDPRR